MLSPSVSFTFLGSHLMYRDKVPQTPLAGLREGGQVLAQNALADFAGRLRALRRPCLAHFSAHGSLRSSKHIRALRGTESVIPSVGHSDFQIKSSSKPGTLWPRGSWQPSSQISARPAPELSRLLGYPNNGKSIIYIPQYPLSFSFRTQAKI